MKEKLSWHKISTAFEYGDLTPLAVVISVGHYGPVLAAKGDNVVVAWMVGALIDLLHYRTVRRLFQVTGRNQVIGHALVAVVTTAMALGYHLRFYEGDWLLAIPIPVGIAILAQHAAAQKADGERDKEAALDTAIAERDKAASERDTLLSRVTSLQAERDAAVAQARETAAERDKLARKLANGVVHLDRLPVRLADYVTTVASGGTPNGDFTDKHGVGVSTLDRTNRMFLND